MTPEKFQQFADQQFNRIPVVREVLADLDTPLSCYQKLADGAYSYLLESVRGGEKWGRYSIIGLPCRRLLKVFDHRAEQWLDGKLVECEEVADPLAYTEAFQSRFQAAPQEDRPEPPSP